MFSVLLFCSLVGSISLVAGHSTLWSPAMWGFNVTAKTFSYDNRPLVPLSHDTFEKWWFHGHLNYPPPDNTFLELPAGGTLNSEIACDKGATSFFASSPGGNIQSGNNPCPKAPTTAFHANNEADTRGCGLGITYQSDVSSVKPEDFTIFTVNHTCVWNRFTDFQIPADLPACPEGGCICSFNWIHAPDSGSEQIFMNGYRCKVTNANSNKKVATPRLARRCGQNANKNANVAPWNCTYGAKQAMYWLQAEASTFFEGAHDPPFYNDLYNFPNGAQNDIFQDSQLPVFNEAGEQTGFTTLGGSSATTVNIVTPSSSSGWPTTTSAASGQQVAATGGPDSSSSSSSSSVPASSGSSSKASVATNVAKNPSSSSSSSQAPAPTTSSSSSQTHASSSGSSSSSSTSTSTSTSTFTADASSSSSSSSSSATTKCRKRESNAIKKTKKRAFGAHKKMSKRHDMFF